MKQLRVIFCAALGFVFSASAQFAVFDNFDSYTPGASLIGQGPVGNLWNQTIGAATSVTGQVLQASSGGLATFVGPTLPVAAYRNLGPLGLTLANATISSTVF